MNTNKKPNDFRINDIDNDGSILAPSPRPRSGLGLNELLADIVLVGVVDKFSASLAMRLGAPRLHLVHSHSFQQTDGWEVTCIRDSNHFLGARAPENQRDGFLDSGSGQAAAMGLAPERESDLCLTTVTGKNQADVTNEVKAIGVCNANLAPSSGLQQRCLIHMLEEIPGVLIRGGHPALIAAEVRVLAIRLEVDEIRRGESAQNNATGSTWKEIDHVLCNDG